MVWTHAGMLAAAADGVNWGQVLGYLIATGIIGVVSGVLTAHMATRELRANVGRNVAAVATLTETVSTVQREISDLKVNRVNCELRAGTKYATHAEVGNILGQQMSHHDALLSKLDAIHGRVTPLAERISTLEGTVHAAMKGAFHAD